VVAKDGFGETIMTVPSTQTVVIIQKATSITGLPATKLITSEAPVAAMTYTVQPSLTNDKSVVWTSSNDSIATVSANGTIYPHKNGTVTIKVAIADDPSISGECVVTIQGVIDYCRFTLGNYCVTLPRAYKVNYGGASGMCAAWGGTLPTQQQLSALLPVLTAEANSTYYEGYVIPSSEGVISGNGCDGGGRRALKMIDGVWGTSYVCLDCTKWVAVCAGYGDVSVVYNVACVIPKI
jgi:hypothetical protein